MMSSIWAVLGRVNLCRLVIAALSLSASAHAADWLPITPEDLQQTDEPAAPKAPAIYLYRQVDRNDLSHWERVYVRIKILRDEGRSQGNVAIRFDREFEHVHDIEARTIRPDGSVVKFDGTVYEKPLLEGRVEGRDVEMMTTTFSLPEVQPGCIIEYRYEIQYNPNYVYSSQWIVNADLYTKLAKFSLVPYRGEMLRAATPVGLPPDSVGPTFQHGVFTMVTRDVPAFVAEEYMPPEDELKMRVEFLYLRDSTIDKDAPTFWARWAKGQYEETERYMNQKRAMQEALAQIVSQDDSPEQKLRKIYARVLQIGNLSYGRKRTTEELERESAKNNENVADVWRHGYGAGAQITYLFVALARAAGFESNVIALATRNRFFFSEELRNPAQLNARIAVVTRDGQDVFLAPGTPFTPFGLLPWHETAVRGLRINQSGGGWVQTPVPPASQSRLGRKAVLRLTPEAGLEGTVTYTFTGLYALAHRIDERNEDDTERRRWLEDYLKAQMTSGGEVTLTNVPNWTDGDVPLVAVFDVKLPGRARTIGQRALVPVALFADAGPHVFEHASRTHPVYFHYPYELDDDVTIDLPPGWKLSSLPPAGNKDINIADCKWTVQTTATGLHLTRDFSMHTLLVKVNGYGQLQDFYRSVRSGGDEEAIVSLPVGANAHTATSGL